jgi:hypothetical protein
MDQDALLGIGWNLLRQPNERNSNVWGNSLHYDTRITRGARCKAGGAQFGYQ